MALTLPGGLSLTIDLNPPLIGLALEIPGLLTIAGGIDLSGLPLLGLPGISLPTLPGGDGLPGLGQLLGSLDDLLGGLGGLPELPVPGSFLDIGGTHFVIPLANNT